MMLVILVHDKIHQSVAQTFLSVRFEAVFNAYTGKNACATKEEFTHLFLNNPLIPQFQLILHEVVILFVPLNDNAYAS